MATRPDLRPSTMARDDIVMRRLVLPTFSSRTLGSIIASDLRSWLTDMAGEGYSSTGGDPEGRIMGSDSHWFEQPPGLA